MITGILTLHKEGKLAHHTLGSIRLSLQHAKARGLSSELLIICDRPSTDTIAYVQNLEKFEECDCKIHTVDFGDPGLSRNFGVSLASGDVCAVLDGDDLYSENWLFESYAVAVADEKTIAHPELNIIFDGNLILFPHATQDQTAFDPSGLIFENYWTSLCVAKKEIFLTVPYQATDSTTGYGFEDHHWNCETINAGYLHKTVERTVHFIRHKRLGSRNAAAFTDNLICRHSTLFSNPAYWIDGEHETLP